MAQVGRFSSWGTVVPKSFLAKVPTPRRVHKSLNRVLIKEAITRKEVNPRCTKEGP